MVNKNEIFGFEWNKKEENYFLFSGRNKILLCADKVHFYLGEVDYVCMSKHCPEYVGDEAYKAVVRKFLDSIYFLDIDPARFPKHVPIYLSQMTYVFNETRDWAYYEFGFAPFYIWGEYK